MARPEPVPGRGALLTLGDVTPGRKAALGRLDPHARPFLGLAWSSRYSQSNPRARDTMLHGFTRAWAGKRGRAGARGRDPQKEGLFGEAGPPSAALFGLSVVHQVQPFQPPGHRL